MIGVDLYMGIGWHIAISIAILIWGIGVISSKEDTWWGIILMIFAISYFLFAPYAHDEEIRNCRTKNGNTVAVTVKFKEPIVKFLFVEPRDVKITSIDGVEKDLELQKNTNFGVYGDNTTLINGSPDPSGKLNLTPFTGKFKDKNGNDNELLLIL